MTTLLPPRNFVLAIIVLTALFAIVACGQDTETIENTNSIRSDGEPEAPVKEVGNLPTAPDFTLPAANRDNSEISLSQFQSDKNVVLVFYRAYW